ncbi:MAG TPA: Zn-dependent hydrolase [Candidatus Dormibacteraeota bacterium]
MDGASLLGDLDHLATIGADPGGGVSRVAYSTADVEARAWVRETMLGLGMQVRRDEALNVMGRYPGLEPRLKPLAVGSHTDTVPNGGRFDGALGVVGALACVRALAAAGVHLRHPVEVIDFAAEEATLGGGTLGSLAMTGRLQRGALTRPAWDGRPAAEHLRDAGLDPLSLSRAVRPGRCLAAYLELHIEQGGTLEAEGVPIGVVEGIVGIRRCAVTFAGQANHAGTTAMAGRRDALVMAAPFVLGVRDAAIAAGIVGTAGVLRVEPGAPNVIPGRVEVEAEFRGLDEAVLDRVEAELGALAERLGGEFARVSAKPPTSSHPLLVAAVEAACDALGLARRRMASGAGHDAMVIGERIPQAMIFVPSVGGVSHSPDELTPPERCVDGARVLLRALLELDERLDA